ncbi:hypothetical protein J6590_040114 [Homalodisca vitripennis]|nr:hypothetical protein J6590_040114 [Homalodisca vitripennis]
MNCVCCLVIGVRKRQAYLPAATGREYAREKQEKNIEKRTTARVERWVERGREGKGGGL